MASWRIRFHDKWPHLASLYASTHNLDEDGKHPEPMMGQDNIFDPSEPYGAYRFYMQPSPRSEFSIEEPPYMSRPVYKDEESKSSGYTSGESLGRGSTCRVLLCVFLVVSFIGVVVAAITLAVVLSQIPTPLRRKSAPAEEFESTASIFARDFNDKLLDNSSDEFLSLEEEFCKAIEQIFTESESPVKHAFGGCEVIEFINGSVQVRYRLKLVSKSPETFKMNNKILQKLQEHFAKKVNEIGPWQKLKFNPRFLKQFIRIEPQTTPVPATVTSTEPTTTETKQMTEATTGHTETTKADILIGSSTTQESPTTTTFEETTNITGVITEGDITTIPSDQADFTNATGLPDTVTEKEVLPETTTVQTETNFTETSPSELVTEAINVTKPMESNTTKLPTEEVNVTQPIDTTTLSFLSSSGTLTTTVTILSATEIPTINETINVNVTQSTTLQTPEETTPDWFDFFYDYQDVFDTTETSVATDGLPTSTESGMLSNFSDATTTSLDVSSPSVFEDNATAASEVVASVQPSTISTESTVTVDTAVETTIVTTVIQTTIPQNATVPVTLTEAVLITAATTPLAELSDISTEATITQEIPALSNVTDTDKFKTTVADTTESHITLVTTHNTTEYDTTHAVTTTKIVSHPSSNVTSAAFEDEVDMTTTTLNITSDAPKTTTVQTNVTATSSDIVNITEHTVPETTIIVDHTTAAHGTKALPIVTGQVLVETTTAVSDKTIETQNVTEMPVDATTSEASEVFISTEVIKIESTMSTDTANVTEAATIKLIKTSEETVKQTTEAGIEVDLATKPDVHSTTDNVKLLTTSALSTDAALDETISARSTTSEVTDIHTTISPQVNETSSIARPEITTTATPVENITRALKGVSDIVLLNMTDIYDYNTSDYYDYETTTAEDFLFDMSTDIPVDNLTISGTTETGPVQATTVVIPLVTESTEEYLEFTQEQILEAAVNQTTEAPRQTQNDTDITGVTIQQMSETVQNVTDISTGIVQQTTLGTAISGFPITTPMEHIEDTTTHTHGIPETAIVIPSDTTTEDVLVIVSSEADNTTEQSTTTATDTVAVTVAEIVTTERPATVADTTNISQVVTLEMDRITTDASNVTVSSFNLTIDVPVEGGDGNFTEQATADIDSNITIVSETVRKATTDMPIGTTMQMRNESAINATESTLSVTSAVVTETTAIDTSNDTMTSEATINATDSIDGEHNTTLDIQTTTKSSESAFLDEYGEAAFIKEYIPTSSNITEETSVLNAVNATAAVHKITSLPKETNFSLLVPENVTEIAMEDMSTERPLAEANLTLISENATRLEDNITVQSTVAAYTGITVNVTTAPELNITGDTAMTTYTHLTTTTAIVETSSIKSNATDLIKNKTDTEWIPATTPSVEANVTLKLNVTELTMNETDTEWVPEITHPAHVNVTLKSNVTELARNETDAERVEETTLPVEANVTLKSNVTELTRNETDAERVETPALLVESNVTLKSNVTELTMNEIDAEWVEETALPVEANVTLKSNVTELTLNEIDTESVQDIIAAPVQANFTLRSNVTELTRNETDTFSVPETSHPAQVNATLKSNVTELTKNETDAEWVEETTLPFEANVTLKSNVTELTMNETDTESVPETTVPALVNVTLRSNVTELTRNETDAVWVEETTVPDKGNITLPLNITEIIMNETMSSLQGNITTLSNLTEIIVKEPTTLTEIPLTTAASIVETRPIQRNVTETFINETTHFTEGNATSLSNVTSIILNETAAALIPDTAMDTAISRNLTIQNVTMHFNDTTESSVTNEIVVQNTTLESNTTTQSPNISESSTELYNYNTSDYYYDNDTDYYYDYDNVTTEAPTLNVTKSTVFNITGIANLTRVSAETSTIDFNGTESNGTYSTTTDTITVNVTDGLQKVTETTVVTDVTTVIKPVP